MLLRRIIAHVKAQNWTAVALDFFIVVTGVFIGIQVANWNDGRRFDARERELLLSLRTEVEAAIAATNQKISSLEQVGAAGARALAHVESGEAYGADCWPILIDFFHASQWQNVWVGRSTFDEMRRQSLPRSREIVDAVEAYHAQNATLAVTLLDSPAYRTLVRGLIPLEIQDVYWTQCYSASDGVEHYSLDCSSGDADGAAADVVAAIAAHPDIKPTLTEWTGYVRAMPPTLIAQIRTAERAIALIDAELGLQ